MEKVRVVWICHFSNEQIRSHQCLNNNIIWKLVKRAFGKTDKKEQDFAIWISNGIKEFEKYKDVELTVVFPHAGIRGLYQKFTINSINYICFNSRYDSIISYLSIFFLNRNVSNYKISRKLVRCIIDGINPDIVHVVGAENPYYSSTCLDLPKSIPCLVSLQTLMSEPGFRNHYPISDESYEHRTKYELLVLKRSNYIGIGRYGSHFIPVIRDLLKIDEPLLKIALAVGEEIDDSIVKKEYDFVYFAANINKACNQAIEAFAILSNKYPTITMNVSGYYENNDKLLLDTRIKELGIEDKVFFTGAQKTHKDVIKQIKKSRFAILPLRVDLISGTIREAMASGLPVVTTITPATPILNKKKECVLLAHKDDYCMMARQMQRLLEDELLTSTLIRNAYQLIQEDYSNKALMDVWRKAYYQIIDNFRNGKPFSEDVVY